MDLFDILIIAAMIAVAATLAMGLRTLFLPGEAARARSNRLMRLRVALQAGAVILLVAAIWWRSSHGG